ncbi:MAG: hypothetical protein E4G96_02240 [Chrysiogenales bacterium]|nr:MAG: hypothetical protein E4G96_02240 [Chrysiogenales bacterium]
MKNGFATATNIIITALFVTVLWLPILDNLFNIAPVLPNMEQRSLSQLPELRLNRKSIADFHGKFVKYFIDNFGFRAHLIRWNSLFKLKVMKVEQFPKVLVGKDDWLYLVKDDDGNNPLDFYRAIGIFRGPEEIAAWSRPLVEIGQRLAKKGIRFIVIFAPMKTSVYPEFIPDYFKPVRDTTRLDQIKEYLVHSTTIEFIDLGDAVREGKEGRRVFFKYDVHWNSYGAFYAYRKIMDALVREYPRMRPLSLDDYTVEKVMFPGGDLAGMLGLKDVFSEEYPHFMPIRKANAVRSLIPYPAKFSRLSDVYKTGDRTLPRAMVIHDSFFNFIKPFLAEHFERMACFQGYNRVDFSVIEIEKPDIVFFEMVESYTQKSPFYVTPLNLR